MKLWMKIAGISGIGFTVGFASIYFSGRSGDSGTASAADSNANNTPAEIEWGTLRELDTSAGKVTPSIKKLDNALVKIPGFMIPLEDNQSVVGEFLLVPSPMACIHVPPPPPNQIVHVRMASGHKAKMSFGPIWIQGKLRVAESTGPYGKTSYEMTGDFTEPFQ